MTYSIRKTDDSLLVNLGEEVIDTETVSGIGLIGRLTPNYGETQSNNFVHLLENFASKNFPKNPLVGQICYKKNNEDGSLYVCVNNSADLDDSERWKKIPSVIVADSISETLSLDTGDMWYDTINKAFKIYDSELGEWLNVGPDNYNYTDIVVDKIDSIDDVVYIGNYNFSKNHNKSNSSYLITAKIIAKELPQAEGMSMDSSLTSAWIFNMLVNCRLATTTSPIVCEMVDEPDYQLIGTNAQLYNWNVQPYIDGTILRFECKGNPQLSSNKVSWTIKMDILKVN